MTALNDIWKEFNNRISSPLFGSYLISWLIYNYQVPIGLIFMKNHELGPLIPSYFELINLHTNLDNWLVPLFCSAVYILFYPWVRDKIKLRLALIDHKTNEKLQKQADFITIPVLEYAKKQRELKSYEIELAEIVNDEKTTKNELDTAETRIQQLVGQASANSKQYENDKKILEINHLRKQGETEKKYAKIIDDLKEEKNNTIVEHKKTQSQLESDVRQQETRIATLELEEKNLKNELINNELDHKQAISILGRDFENRISEKEREYKDAQQELKDFNLQVQIERENSHKEYIQKLNDAHKDEMKETIREATETFDHQIRGFEQETAESNSMIEQLLQERAQLDSDIANANERAGAMDLEYLKVKGHYERLLSSLEPLFTREDNIKPYMSDAQTDILLEDIYNIKRIISSNENMV